MDNGIKEIVQPSFGSYGSCYVDGEFCAVLRKLFGKDIIKQLKVKSQIEWLTFIDQFKIAKMNMKADSAKELRLKMSVGLNQVICDLKGKDIPTVIAGFPDEEISFRHGSLVIGPNLVKTIFKKACTEIVKHLNCRLQNEAALEDVNSLLLVGEFGNPAFLQDAFTTAFGGKYKVLVPHSADTLIVQGAVMLGHQPYSTYVRLPQRNPVLDDFRYSMKR